MALTLGDIAPLGRPTGGELNFAMPTTPAHLLYLHALPQRIRGRLDDVIVVDTLAARLLHETRLLPRWYLPRADVRTDLLEPSDTVTHCPFKGDARYWNLRIGERVVEDAFWEYPDPLPGAPVLGGLLSPYMEQWGTWLDEDEEIEGHPRDPFHRVDARRSSRAVTVTAGGREVARSTAAVSVNETGLPTRWYLPATDVAASLLEPSDTSTHCPYKGRASYWHLVTGDTRVKDAVWSYRQPFPEAIPVAGYLSFLGEGVEVAAEPA